MESLGGNQSTLWWIKLTFIEEDSGPINGLIAIDSDAFRPVKEVRDSRIERAFARV